jgi:hypothetical protein
MMKLALSVAVLLAVLCFPGRSAAYSSIRCGNRLASAGATRGEVLALCGEPLSKESRTEVIRSSQSADQRQSDRGTQSQTQVETGGSVSTEVVLIKNIDEWTYNFGPSELMRTVVFENGRLVRVETGMYGF